jgi:hypothetical protein
VLPILICCIYGRTRHICSRGARCALPETGTAAGHPNILVCAGQCSMCNRCAGSDHNCHSPYVQEGLVFTARPAQACEPRGSLYYSESRVHISAHPVRDGRMYACFVGTAASCVRHCGLCTGCMDPSSSLACPIPRGLAYGRRVHCCQGLATDGRLATTFKSVENVCEERFCSWQGLNDAGLLFKAALLVLHRGCTLRLHARFAGCNPGRPPASPAWPHAWACILDCLPVQRTHIRVVNTCKCTHGSVHWRFG